MKSRRLLLGVLAGVILLGVWQLSSKRDLLTLGQLRDAWQDVTGNHGVAGQGEDETYNGDEGALVVDPVPVIRDATEAEMFPFRADVPLLETTVPLTERKIPLVYVAYCGNSQDQFTSASRPFGEHFKFQIQSEGGGTHLINAIPNKNLWTLYRRSYKDNTVQMPYDAHLADARDLASDFFFYPVFDGDTSQPQVTVKMVDMMTSRTETWSSADSGLSSVHDIVIGAARAALRFAGIADTDIEKAGVGGGAPSDATFAWYATTNVEDRTYEDYLKVIAEDPDCRYTYGDAGGTTWVGQLVQMGLQRFPEDVRLITKKASALNDAQSTDVLVRYTSELIRRYPNHTFTYGNLANQLNVIFDQSANPKETPEVYLTMLEQMYWFCEKYPEYYSMKWEYAYGIKSLGDYIRGGHTVDRIPNEIMAERLSYVQHAFQVMWGLVEERPENLALLKAFIHFDNDVGYFNASDQRSYVRRIARLDERDTSVEMKVAGTHSIGYGNREDYFAVIDRAILRHGDDPEAMAAIAYAIQHELYRQVGWKVMTDDEANSTSNPYGARFVKLADFVYSRGKNLDWESDWAYYSIAGRERPELLDKWKESGQNAYYAAKLANQAYDASDRENCIKYVKMALPRMKNDDKGHYCRYWGVKSLWKLKRYDESLKMARKGIFEFPTKQTFPYMYAVVALESGEHLEAAYDCAWRAVDLGTDNQGCNETFEKLRQKLNRPDHPALIALKNQGLGNGKSL